MGKIKMSIMIHKFRLPLCFLFLLFVILIGCNPNEKKSVKPKIKGSENGRYLELENSEPFFWLGGTVWGMSQWLTREDVDYYLDDRKEKGFNLVQICLFWGKRQDDPVNFFVNPLNAYGHKAFKEINGKIDPTLPHVVEGGSPPNPNDYWDHVEYILKAAEDRNMIIAMLPVWGRRYVNATHTAFSEKIFSKAAMKSFGKFLGQRFKAYSNIIWVMGGDVQADNGGDFLGHYRAMAEGIITGMTNKPVKWNEESPLWDYALMTYHPDGTPYINSSEWFHKDTWLDFNMIETWQHRDAVYAAVQQDYALNEPVKPTVMGEPAYEGDMKPHGISKGIHMRRQAYHSFFAGAAGFTYGAFRDKEGNGPLFSPFKGWKKLLDMEGAKSMKFVKSFCLDHNWPYWTPVHYLIQSNQGEGELQKVAVISESINECLIYFPDNSTAKLDLSKHFKDTEKILAQWYNPASGNYSDKLHMTHFKKGLEVIPPVDWSDAILILSQ